MRVELSYEEKILNALWRVPHKRGEDALARGKKDFDAMREVLTPLYDELAQLRLIAEHAKTLVDTKWTVLDPSTILESLKNLREAVNNAGVAHDLYQRYLEACAFSSKLTELQTELWAAWRRIVDKVRDCCGDASPTSSSERFQDGKPFCEKCKALKFVAIDLDGVITRSVKGSR